jgi:hypothetical protein
MQRLLVPSHSYVLCEHVAGVVLGAQREKPRHLSDKSIHEPCCARLRAQIGRQVRAVQLELEPKLPKVQSKQELF